MGAVATATAGALLVLGMPGLATAEEVPVPPSVTTSTEADASSTTPSADPTPTEPAPSEPAPADPAPAEPAPETPPAGQPAQPAAEEPPGEEPPTEGLPVEETPAAEQPTEQPPAVEAPADVPADAVEHEPPAEAGRSTTVEPFGVADPEKPVLAVVKKVTDTRQQADGSWEIDYSVRVQNPPWGSRTTYDLSDTLERFGDGIVVNAAGWGGPGGRTGVWSPGDPEAILADDVTIWPGSTHRYEIAVHATVTEQAIDDGTWTCSGHGRDGGFRNVAELRFGGSEDDRSRDGWGEDERSHDGWGEKLTATACDEPAFASAGKTVVGGEATLNPDGTFTVEYEIVVGASDEHDTFYDLSDELQFAPGASTDASAVDPDGTPVAGWTGRPGATQLATARPIAAGDTEVWHITVDVDLGDLEGLDALLCDGTPANGLYNGATFTNGGLTDEISACANIPTAELTLVKLVDNSALDGLPVEGADPSDFTLLADYDGSLGIEAIGSSDGETFEVPAGTWTLAERPTTGQTNPLVPDFYSFSDWDCSPTESVDSTVELAVGDRVTCEITNTAEPDVDVSLTKTHELEPGSDGSVEGGDAFTWVLAIENLGMPLEHLEVTDLIDDQLVQTGPATFDPADGWVQVSDVGDPEFTAEFTGLLGTDERVEIRIPVRMLDAEPVQTPPAVGPDDPAPELPPLDESPMPNEACVSIVVPDEGPGLQDSNPDNDCDTDEVPVKRIDPGAYVRCVNDVPWLYYSIQTTDSVQPGPVTVTWTSADGSLTKVETIPADELTGRLLWPGAAVDANGIPYQFPGWRPITEADLTNPPVPGDRFLDLILDETVPSYAWRDLVNPATITFSVNPSQTVLAAYPEAQPDCAIERPAELRIDKTASVSSAAPGSDFSYTLQVASVGTGAAEPVTVVDEIPADLRVTRVSTASAPAFPRWDGCAVTGQSAGGYGGVLRCDLVGVLGPNLPTAPPITLSVHLRETASVTSIVNVGEVCWGEAPGDDTGGVEQCGEDRVTVAVPHAGTAGLLSATGFDGEPWLWAGGALLLLGGLAVLIAIRARRNGASG
jgi:hypothetical protein